MYDLSSKFLTFYNDYVVLSSDEKQKLYDKKKLNTNRLKEGLKEYNNDNNTSYRIAEDCIQGSVATSTVIQNEENDYDIDVAIVFDKENLGNKGPSSTRNMVADALGRKTKQFNTEPEVKTSCVRIKYADGYHIDFAVYRRYYDYDKEEYIYEHAGSDWTIRELRGLTNWFDLENNNSNGNLRKVVRLSKMFCKSRESWKNMPSGLNQTVLCDEQLSNYDRIDELFYFTMKNIVDRLDNNTTVLAPVDNHRNLTLRKSDIDKMVKWKNRLKSKIGDLNVLFDDDCTEEEAMEAWFYFFNNDFWSSDKLSKNLIHCNAVSNNTRLFSDTEQFIEDLYPVCIRYNCKIRCDAVGDGFRNKPISEYLKYFRHYLPHNLKIMCEISTNCPKPYAVFWKVKNVGPEAKKRDQIRGQILKRGEYIEEKTLFFGNHYIECYVVKNNECVAIDRVEIPIGRS